MKDILTGKRILLISPQAWSDMWISKHHYASELAKRGNTVYFLNPPSATVRHGSCLVAGEPQRNLFVVNYRPLFPMRWKYRLNLIFDILMRYQVKKINHCIGGPPDIVWDFEPNRQFSDLACFSAKINIYHPVDATSYMNHSTKNADVIFSVSDVILDYFKTSKVPRYFINHGLGSAFKELAERKLANFDCSMTEPPRQLHFGYVGNLLMRYIDHELFMKIVASSPNICFHIWGPYNYSNLSVSEPDASRIRGFIDFLKQSKNVYLYGTKSHADILRNLESIDGFFWCYDNVRDPNRGSNSHKLLEYLSTGKVVVSTLVSTYESQRGSGMLIMADSRDEFLEKFTKVVTDIQTFNSHDVSQKRIRFALENSYSSHLEYINRLLQDDNVIRHDN